MNILSAVYSHPDFYPPTLNALRELEKDHKVYSLTRNVVKELTFSKNIKNYTVGKYQDIRDLEKNNIFSKFLIFFKYCCKMRKIILKEKIDLVLLYDNIPLFSYWLVQKSLRKKIFVWYHNHDIVELNKVRKFSIQWFAAYFEPKIFSRINIFTLPSEERKAFFDLKRFKGFFQVLPNFPAKEFYLKFDKCRLNKNERKFKIIYQGDISENHGIEELISVLQYNANYDIELYFIGIIRSDYKEKIFDLALKNGVRHKIFFHNRVYYSEFPSVTRQHHVGWAVNIPNNIQYATAGKASNKIYEYIAVGLPVVLFDCVNYRKDLENYSWSHYTDLSRDSIIQVLDSIWDDFENKSNAAMKDFSNEFNFENKFNILLDHLNKL